MQAKTIDEVLVRLEKIISDSIANKDRAGYFAALYHKVTYSVKQGILNNEFEDGPRMERLDVIFANRYLHAYDQWKAGQKPTWSWEVAFESTKKRRPLVLQHLLLGMNAHINLDLGIAAVETCKGQDLQPLKRDFNNINVVISALTYQVVNDINRVSPLLSLLGLHAGNYNSILIQFSIGNARDGAWCFAQELSEQTTDRDIEKCIVERDANISQLAQSLVHANPLLKFTLWVVHMFEWRRADKIIKTLKEYEKVYIKLKK